MQLHDRVRCHQIQLVCHEAEEFIHNNTRAFVVVSFVDISSA